jgi:hypothetical protein
MTAAQLKRLAELNACAYDFYRRSNPPAARRFREAAKAASPLARQLVAEEQRAAIRLGIEEVKAELTCGVS